MNQLLRIVGDAKPNSGKPRINVVVGVAKSAVDAAKPVLAESQLRTPAPEAGRATA